MAMADLLLLTSSFMVSSWPSLFIHLSTIQVGWEVATAIMSAAFFWGVSAEGMGGTGRMPCSCSLRSRRNTAACHSLSFKLEVNMLIKTHINMNMNMHINMHMNMSRAHQQMTRLCKQASIWELQSMAFQTAVLRQQPSYTAST